MQGRSLRSFTLDYYRKQGAAVRPLDGGSSAAGADAFEIVTSEGGAIAVTFSADAPAPGEAAGHLVPLTRTSPQYRAILDDLTAGVAVSYRYLVAGPIANAVKTLASDVPAGWRVLEAKLKHVENRPALGFTHRVTFDSLALNACQETIHHHVWDVALGDRLPGIEPLLYQLPCVLLRPDQLPDEHTVQRFLGRTVGVVDAASDVQGEAIERELAGMLAEVEKRTNQYFEQQMANVLQREIQLTDKLDGTIRRLTEAKNPELVARYRQEGEALGQQLEHLKANRERDLQAVETACTIKLEQERDRHELTATTDLVALCHATYDVLTYDAKLLSPDGSEVTWTLRYWPIVRELRFPACPRCAVPMADPQHLASGEFACAHCTSACEGCGVVYERGALVASPCTQCHTAACQACEIHCRACGGAACAEHASGCLTCEAPVCSACVKACAVCDEPLCPEHAPREPAGEFVYCVAHRPAVKPPAPLPIPAPPAPDLTLRVVLAPAPRLAFAPEPAEAPRGEPLVTAVEELPMAVAPKPPAPAPVTTPLLRVAEPPSRVAEPAVAVAADETDSLGAMPLAFFASAAIPGRDVENELDQVDASAFERLFGKAPAVSSKTSSATAAVARVKAAVPAKSARPAPAVPASPSASALPTPLAPAALPAPTCCPACRASLADGASVTCATCGVPSCVACAEGELAPCPACESLEEVTDRDPRLGFVLASFPALAKRRRWAVTEQGPYVVAHWRKLGSWGIVTYYRGAAPILVTQFASGWFGGRS